MRNHSIPSPETRQAISKLLQATSEPKSGDIRRISQIVITSLFDLNPATFSLMLRSVSKTLQETANRILKVYMQVRPVLPVLWTGFTVVVVVVVAVVCVCV